MKHKKICASGIFDHNRILTKSLQPRTNNITKFLSQAVSFSLDSTACKQSMTQQCCRKLLQIWYAPKVAAAATNKTYKNVNQPDFVCSRCVSCSSFWLTRLSRFLRLKNLSMAYTLLSQDR